MTTTQIIALAVGYLLGSIPFGLLLTRLSGRGDLRDIGSGNIGATNVMRTGAKGLAALTLLLDAAKGAAAGAMIGHLYPLWLRFKGGKGVATLLGVIAPLLPIAAIIYALLWVGMLLVWRISSVAGMVAVVSAPITAAVMGERALFPIFLLFAILVIWKHRENIQRLVAGTEPAIGQSTDEGKD